MNPTDLVTHAELSGVSTKPWNDIVAADRGNVYVNSIGFDFPGGEFAPGLVALVTPHGNVRQVAGDVAFPNGMAITPEGRTLIVAESYASQITAFQIGADGGLSDRRVGRRRPATIQTASASMPRALSGTPTWATSTACGSAKAGRSWPQSTWTVVPSPARSAGATTPTCSSSASTTAALRRRTPPGGS